MNTRDERNPHPDRARPARTAGGLDYLHDSAGAPFNYMYPPPASEPWESCSYRTHRVDIVDARPAAQDFLLDHQGFELRDAPTGLTAFDDDESIPARYYPEVEAIACDATGATRALCFDHQVRQRSRGRTAPQLRPAAHPGFGGRACAQRLFGSERSGTARPRAAR